MIDHNAFRPHGCSERVRVETLKAAQNQNNKTDEFTTL